MKIGRRVFYLVCFLVLAGISAATVARIGTPSILSPLIRAVLIAGLAGAPGLIHRRAWPAAVVLLPIGAYLVLRMAIPLPLSIHGAAAQYHFYAQHAQQGAADYARKIFPFDFTNAVDLKLFLSLIVYAAAAVAAFFGLSLRHALPAVVVLLVLLGFALTVDDVGRVVWLPLVFVLLAGCLLMLSRSLKRERWRIRDGIAGGAMVAGAALIALLLVGASPVSAARPWQDWRAWDPFRQIQGTFVFNWVQNYPSLLDPGEDRTIMRVESSLPSYWRANALDTFNGDAWLSGRPYGQEISAVAAGGTFTYMMPSNGGTPKGVEVSEKFQLMSTYTNYFFVGGTPEDLVLTKQVNVRTNGMQALRVNQAIGPTLDYNVKAVIPQLKPEDLVGKGTQYPRDATRSLSLPFPRLSELGTADPAGRWQVLMSATAADQEWLPLYDLNKQVVGDATDPYDITLRVEQYLRTSFTYSLSPPPTDFQSPYAAFLFSTHSGYCQHFAGAMALLLRYNGIPARVAVGFTSGEKQNGTTYIVGTNNAHAWVEAFFPSVGWVAFDPTPGRNLPGSGPSSSTAGFVNPFEQTGSSTTSAQSQSVSPKLAPDTAPVKQGQAASSSAGVRIFTIARFFWVFVLVAAVAAWPVFRSRLRRRKLRRGGPGERLRSSIAALRQLLKDYGIVLEPASTVDDLLLFAANRLDVQCGMLGQRAEAALYGGREPSQEEIDLWGALLAEVGGRLRSKFGWRRTILAWYGLARHRATPGRSQVGGAAA